MKHKTGFACLLAAMLVTRCSNQNSRSAEESVTQADSAASAEPSEAATDPAEGTTDAAQTVSSTAEQSSAAESTKENTSDATTASVTTVFQRQEPTAMITTTVTEAVLGGQGGEEHAEDAAPLYFSYRFTEEGVSMRLAGGNYQSIEYDFAEMLEHAAGRDLYSLVDFNFDGNLDLCVPFHWDGDNVFYVVFLWEPDTEHFSETELYFINPIVCPQSMLVCEITYDGNIGAELTQREWFEGFLESKMVVQANFDALALAVADDMTNRRPSKTESYDTHEELEKAFLSYLPG